MELLSLLKCISLAIFLLHCARPAEGGPVQDTRTNLRPRINPTEAQQYLADLEGRYSQECNKEMTKRWDYITNVTEVTEQASINATLDFLAFQAQIQQEILDRFPDWQELEDPMMRREFQFLAIRGPGNMNSSLLNEMKQLQGKMETAYATGWVCDYANQNPDNCTRLLLEPDLEEKLRAVENYDELAYYWTAWHDTMAKAVPTSDYKRFIELQNEQAKANGYADMGELWAAPYDDGTPEFNAAKFEQDMLNIWEQLRPYYKKLHAYARMKLRRNPSYAEKINKFGYIPANLLGNMWAQDWTKLDEDTKPFPNAPSLDATEAMNTVGYTVDKMFDVSDEFFKGLGLLEMTETFKEKSMKERPNDRSVVCHASAEDFCSGAGNQDFRIKMCTNVNQEDLITVHHEMGHIEYFMQYTDKHYIFRDGANPGFHEAIGDALALAVTTPKHLQCVLNLPLGLDLDCDDTTPRTGPYEVTETDLNFLYLQALIKFSFFPFAISMDSWRWGVFNGSITEDQYNSKWWEIRQMNQGIEPPSSRQSSQGLDAAAKYHIVGNVEYIRYFISHILQFQFYESLCIKAGEFNASNPDAKPLYQCDFDGSPAAGEAFAEMMRLGFSEPWPVALERITGTRTYDIKPLINYFQPLFDHMDMELATNGEIADFGDEAARKYINDFYEKEASSMCNLVSVADFEFQTNLTSTEAEERLNEAMLTSAKFDSDEYAANISMFDVETQITDPDLRRQLKFLSAIGTSALSTTDLERYNYVLSEMSKIYGAAKICPFSKQNCDLDSEGLNLEPEMTEVLAKLEDYDELAYVWKGWRDASGKKMRELYKEYVVLSNRAAVLNGYSNMGDYWLLRYESDTFRDDMKLVLDEVKEKLYEPLYNYVRFKLSQKFYQIDPEGPMPAHILGNMWSQTWENVLPYVLPAPDEPFFDITETLVQTVGNVFPPPSEMEKRTHMFNFANAFFKDLGLAEVISSYGENAMILKPTDGREVICHASAWDMCDGKDFRIKMCTEINHLDFITIHHELGHIQYYMQYVDQPLVYRTGANPGFHEAIGDVVALSVSTPTHLKMLGLLPESTTITEKSMLNFLMQMALDKIAFLPFGYMIDAYRWKVFSGEISPDNLTEEWVKMRAEYQGIVPPFKRNETDFDPGAKYHVPANTPYIRYFFSYILQFQIHEVLCREAGHPADRPLYECDIDKNAAAGAKFKEILMAGGSRNWEDLLFDITGERKLNANAIINYFQPLIDFMNEEQTREHYATGFNVGNIEDYIGDSNEPLPTRAPPTSVYESTTDMREENNSTEPEISSTTEPEDEDSNTSTAAIVVGVILGVVVVVIAVGYFVGKKCRKSK